MKTREYKGNDGEGQLEKQEDNQENSESRKDVVKTEGAASILYATEWGEAWRLIKEHFEDINVFQVNFYKAKETEYRLDKEVEGTGAVTLHYFFHQFDGNRKSGDRVVY